MARVPITVMGFRCDRCGHEWIPRRDPDEEPRACPKCKSRYWNKPRTKSATTYDDFRNRIEQVLQNHRGGLPWSQIRTVTKLPQAFPNNRWVKRLETDIGLVRERNDGVLIWTLPKS